MWWVLALMVCSRLDRRYKVGIAANGDRAFAWIQAEQLGRRGGDQFDEAVHVKASLRNAAGIDQAHAMLDAGPPLGILVKSPMPISFCSLKQNGQ